MDNNYVGITQQELDQSKSIILKINNYYFSKMVGQYQLGTALLAAMMCNGHILLESVPGLAKTTAAKTMTEAVNGTFSRIQCTPDLLPSDIVGTQILNYTTNTFETKLGPVYANFVLLDEINRSSAKTQSAMLEAMQEHKVTVANTSYKMDEPFFVLATENPIEQDGTYPLPEAQMDRFMFKVVMNFPTIEELKSIVTMTQITMDETANAVIDGKTLLEMREITKQIPVIDEILSL